MSENRTLSPDDIKRVKGLGCLQDKRYTDIFNVRVITRNGRITTDEVRSIAEAADTYGSGKVAMTSRLTIEIQGVQYDNIEPMIAFLQSRGLDCGGTGAKVRPVVSCKGTTCQYGLIDTFSLSEKIHDKFKIAVGGCPNNCVKPELNDLSVIGQRYPTVDPDKCKGCKKCQVELSCPIKIAKVVDGKMVIDPNTCNHCGRCHGKCLFDAITYTDGYKVSIGGRWGKKTATAQPLNKVFTTEEEVLAMVEKVICFFRDEGIAGERFADTIARLGFDYVEDKLLNK